MAESGHAKEDWAERWNAREIARRTRTAGKPLSPVMQTAATAVEFAHARANPPREDS